MPVPTPGGNSRRASRAPFRTEAPTITGSAICREITFASARRKPRQRAAVEGGAVAGDSGRERERLRRADHDRVHQARLLARAPLRPPVGDRHRHGAGDQRDRDRVRLREAALDRPLEPQRDQRRGREGERQAGKVVQPERPQVLAHLLPEADQQRHRTTGVERHLDRLADLGVELAVGPAQHRRHQHEVSGAGDGKQLGRSLDRAECGGVRDREPVVAQGARVSVAGFPGRLLRITKYTIIAMIPATIT